MFVPFLPNGEKRVRVLGVKFEGFAYIRPTHGAGREKFVFGVAPLEAKQEDK